MAFGKGDHDSVVWEREGKDPADPTMKTYKYNIGRCCAARRTARFRNTGTTHSRHRNPVLWPVHQMALDRPRQSDLQAVAAGAERISLS